VRIGRVIVVAASALALTGCGGGQPCPAWPEGAVRGGLTLSYNGYGTARACQMDGGWRWQLAPKAATRPSITHAALARAPAPAGDVDVQVRLRTPHRLRHGGPNSWEAGWLLWRYTDDRHFYYLMLKPHGYELGKEDPAYPGDQRFLVTEDTPGFDLAAWHTLRIRQRGATITAYVNGHPLVTVQDHERPYFKGDAALYTEDAVAVFDRLRVA
jgi:hypothetical protein